VRLVDEVRVTLVGHQPNVVLLAQGKNLQELFAADHAEQIEEIDLNPVLVHPEGQGLTVVDALIVKRKPEENRK